MVGSVSAVLLTNSLKLAQDTLREVERLLTILPTADIARQAWRDYGEVIVCESYEEMLAEAERIASEHVQVMTARDDWFLSRMTNYGALEMTYNREGEEVTICAVEGSVISVPAGCWRRYRAVGGDMEATLTTQGDQRKRLYWDREIIARALEHDRCLDPDGYIAIHSILPASARRAGEKIASAAGGIA